MFCTRITLHHPLVLPHVLDVGGDEGGDQDPQQREHPRHGEHARVAQREEQQLHLGHHQQQGEVGQARRVQQAQVGREVVRPEGHLYGGCHHLSPGTSLSRCAQILILYLVTA